MEINKEKLFLEWVYKNSNNNLVCLDIGSNKGFYSEMLIDVLRDKLEHLYCYEPVEKNYNVCIDKFENNEKVTLLMKACSNKNESKSFFQIIADNIGDEGLSSLNYRNVFKNYNCQKISVDCIVLNDFLQIDSEKDMFVKIDVEGHELEVLEGMSMFFKSGQVKYLQFEYGNCMLEQGKNLNDIIEWLSKFKEYKICDFTTLNFIEIDNNNINNYINSAWCNLYIIKK